MITIKGVYENGQIKLLEEPPVNKKNKVLITFIDDSEADSIRELSIQQLNTEFTNYLEDKREDLYQEYIKVKKA